jgi:hypothetical protein
MLDRYGGRYANTGDLAAERGILRVGGNNKGVFTPKRRPWASAYLLRRRWRRPSDPSTLRSVR